MATSRSEPSASSVSLLDRSDLWRRLAVTAGVMAVLLLGGYVPLPGIDVSRLVAGTESGGYDASALTRVSMMALVTGPLVSAYLLAELFKMAIPPVRRWEQTDRYAYNRLILVLALVISAAEGLGLAVGFEQLDGASRPTVDEPGWLFRLSTMVTLVAATALVSWLADQVTRHGVGSGLWVLMCLSIVMMLPTVWQTVPQLLQQGRIVEADIVAVLVFLGLSVAALAALFLAPGSRASLWDIALYPILLAELVWLYARKLALMFAPLSPLTQTALVATSVLSLAVMGTLIAVFTALRARVTSGLSWRALAADKRTVLVVTLYAIVQIVIVAMGTLLLEREGSIWGIDAVSLALLLLTTVLVLGRRDSSGAGTSHL